MFSFYQYFRLLSGVVMAMLAVECIAEETDTIARRLTVDLEIRPRVEFRDGYRLLPAESFTEIYASQRNRLNLTYSSKRLRIQNSFQEIHVWGQPGSFSQIGSINFYELFLEPVLTRHLSFRIGRQALSLDNGRLFSAAPWAQQSRAHEGLRIFYKEEKLKSDLTLAFTRPYSREFDINYSPVASHRYLFLAVHHLSYKLPSNFALITINSIEKLGDKKLADSHYYRLTSGGRLEFNRARLYLTLSAYYQYGQNAALKRLSAYYWQPEIRVMFSRWSWRLGSEMLSGGNAQDTGEPFRSFVPPYGVAWKFMGNINFFARFPADVANSGLLNPYLNVLHQFSKKISLRADAHLFYSQYPLVRNLVTYDRYLGFETDWSVQYKASKNIEINGGVSFFLPTKSITLLGKVRSEYDMPLWSYLMISYNPRIFEYKKVTRK